MGMSLSSNIHSLSFFSYDFNPSNNVSSLIAPLGVEFSHVSTSTPGRYTFHLFLKS